MNSTWNPVHLTSSSWSHNVTLPCLVEAVNRPVRVQEEVAEILRLDGGVVISLVTWFPMMPCPGFYFYF